MAKIVEIQRISGLDARDDHVCVGGVSRIGDSPGTLATCSFFFFITLVTGPRRPLRLERESERPKERETESVRERERRTARQTQRELGPPAWQDPRQSCPPDSASQTGGGAHFHTTSPSFSLSLSYALSHPPPSHSLAHALQVEMLGRALNGASGSRGVLAVA